jgi:hypothetical protein
MTELKEKRKCRKFTQSETNMRNLMLKKLHESGDFDRCVVSLRGLNVVIYLYNNACYTSPHVSFLFNAVTFCRCRFKLCCDLGVVCVANVYHFFSCSWRIRCGQTNIQEQTPPVPKQTQPDHLTDSFFLLRPINIFYYYKG